MPSNFISFLISKHSNNVKIVLIPISVLLNFLRFSVRISQIYSPIKSPIILHGKCRTTQFRRSCNLRLSSLHWQEPRNLQLNKKKCSDASIAFEKTQSELTCFPCCFWAVLKFEMKCFCQNGSLGKFNRKLTLTMLPLMQKESAVGKKLQCLHFFSSLSSPSA